MPSFVDVVVLTRDERAINDEVLTAIQSQQGVKVQLHHVVGTPRPDDANRWQTISRARNVGRALGHFPWLMFVDDDVVLAQDTIAQLLQELEARPDFWALGADYLNERDSNGISPHVAMGATLFRREALSDVEFRWEKNKCECWCMADDLRKRFRGIDYSQTAAATHLHLGADAIEERHSGCQCESAQLANSKPEDAVDDRDTERDTAAICGDMDGDLAGSSKPNVSSVYSENAETKTLESVTVVEGDAEHQQGQVLTAFDRNHWAQFVGPFLGRLRRFGNNHTVHAVAYGLEGKQLRSLRELRGVEVHPQPLSQLMVCRSRMVGFQSVLSKLCPKTPIAYWDAGDVLFQTSLEPLWDLVREQPGKLLVVEEPLPFSRNACHRSWISAIQDRTVRTEVFDLLEDKPVINGGFVAGKAGELLKYFEAAEALARGDLLGAGGGDQVVLNYYRYRNPDSFVIIDDTWNYCLAGRSGRSCKVKRGRYLDMLNRRLVSVVHGNSGTLF